jgi:hypothetical protein
MRQRYRPHIRRPWPQGNRVYQTATLLHCFNAMLGHLLQVLRCQFAIKHDAILELPPHRLLKPGKLRPYLISTHHALASVRRPFLDHLARGLFREVEVDEVDNNAGRGGVALVEACVCFADSLTKGGAVRETEGREGDSYVTVSCFTNGFLDDGIEEVGVVFAIENPHPLYDFFLGSGEIL